MRPTPTEGLSPKFQLCYKGPFVITAVLGANALIVATPNRGKPSWVHLNHLKRAVPRCIDELDRPTAQEPQLQELPQDVMPPLVETDADKDTRSAVKVEPKQPEMEGDKVENDNDIVWDNEHDNEEEDDEKEERRYLLRSRK